MVCYIRVHLQIRLQLQTQAYSYTRVRGRSCASLRCSKCDMLHYYNKLWKACCKRCIWYVQCGETARADMMHIHMIWICMCKSAVHNKHTCMHACVLASFHFAMHTSSFNHKCQHRRCSRSYSDVTKSTRFQQCTLLYCFECTNANLLHHVARIARVLHDVTLKNDAYSVAVRWFKMCGNVPQIWCELHV